ncbi:hypothetical protein ACE1AT_09755 [Pelatocladus sp. BLCC-F211]|uniref:hypothetical protein n=1 Tax=Pelatocladus sp. BLCC-F211 TaxID=3342752 RepID=UPI0035B7ECF1
MKRTISLVIGIFISFLMMFSSVAMADGIKVTTPTAQSEVTTSEVVEVTPKETNQASVSQPKASDWLEDKDKLDKKNPKACTLICSNGLKGYSAQGLCVPCYY